MTERESLPDRRAQETASFTFRNIVYDLSVGRFEDGRLAEVFIACSKSTSPAAADARDACVLISIACQYGADPATLHKAVTRVDDFDGGRQIERPDGIGGVILEKIVELLGGFGPFATHGA